MGRFVGSEAGQREETMRRTFTLSGSDGIPDFLAVDTDSLDSRKDIKAGRLRMRVNINKVIPQ
jgi:hypothetical protein